MPASFAKRKAFVNRRARPLIFFSALILLGAAISRLAASGSSPTIPMPGPHDPVAAARAGQLAGPAPAGTAPNAAGTRQFQAASIPGPSGPGAQPQVPWATSRVFATRYDPNTAGSVEVAVPDKCVKFAALGDTGSLSNFHCGSGYPVGLDYRVLITRDNGQSMYIPVKDVGPWNIDDNYWDPADSSFPRPRRMFGDLARGTPESQAAYYNGYNTVANCKNLDGSLSGHSGGADQFGRCVLNPSAVDISTAAAAQLGFSGAEWVTASFLWEPIDGLLAYPYAFRGGVFVASGDLNLDGKSEVITGPDVGGGPDVEINEPNGVRVGGFYAYAPSFGGGVRVASGNLLGGNNIATAPGPGGGPDVELACTSESATSTAAATTRSSPAPAKAAAPTSRSTRPTVHGSAASMPTRPTSVAVCASPCATSTATARPRSSRPPGPAADPTSGSSSPTAPPSAASWPTTPASPEACTSAVSGPRTTRPTGSSPVPARAAGRTSGSSTPPGT
ncbi:MAG: hypothetical protein E6G57_09845 [Actinobacteria bacterium]|nr:MAG: hypothetical protein E6G57_09845 [Actinomycetota bacterium]